VSWQSTRALPALAVVARLALAALWLAAGLLKVVDPAANVRAVRAYEVLPEAVVPLVGYGLPFLEIGLGLLLLAGLAVRWAALASAALLVLFVAGVSSAWARGLTIDCGCFGGGGQVAPEDTRYLQELLRDGVALAAAALLAWRPSTPWSLDRLLHAPSPPSAVQPEPDEVTT
jgi:uncharacterized membrane protein YphA (DoxX/SURF4 family)